MNTIQVQRIDDFTAKDYIRRTAIETDYTTLIKESCKLIDKETGELVGVYLVMPKTPPNLIQAIMKIKYQKNKRLAGLITKSRIFGFRNREKVRNDFCSSTSLAVDNPKEHAIICNFAQDLTNYYKKYCGAVFDDHFDIAKEKILDEWRIGDTPFSSGIINQNNALHYHFDAGNFKNVYSNMVAFKSNTKGGYLSIPEYDIGLEIANNSILLFNGQKILHGVTPIKLLSDKAYRYTIVYYTLQQMWKCEPITKELIRIKDERTKLECKRLARQKGEIPNVI